MKIKLVQDAATRFLTENATTVLTAGGVVGTVATAVLAGRAGFKSAQIIEAERVDKAQKIQAEMERISSDPVEPIDPVTIAISKTDKVKLVWPQFIPPVVTGTGTIAAIVMADRMNAKRAAALAAAYGVAQGQLDEYKAKMLDKLGVQKMEKAEAEMADEAMQRSKQSPSQVIIVGDNVLVYDRPTDRYFQSSMEQIRTVEGKANQEILEHGYYTATEFYNALGLKGTTWSDDVGWHQPFQLEYSHTLAPDGRPCLSINFSRMPLSEYVKDHSRYSP